MNEKVLGIIGTAGRKQAQSLMTIENYKKMVQTATDIVKKHNISALVSGGAAFSDHVAVSLYLSGVVDHLFLMLPDAFDINNNHYIPGHYGNITNSLHTIFSEQCHINSLVEISHAIKQGAEIYLGNADTAPGFLTRNTWIAQKSTHLLAFTSGNALNESITEIGVTNQYSDNIIKDNGTKDTWKKSIHKYRIVCSIPLLCKPQQENLFLF